MEIGQLHINYGAGKNDGVILASARLFTPGGKAGSGVFQPAGTFIM
jgi:hypothetical protein